MQQGCQLSRHRNNGSLLCIFLPRAASFSPIPRAGFLIPFTRWLGFVWLIVGGFKQETHDWFQANRRYVKVFQLPPYWPELNATERIWHYTRKHVTHNRFFERPQDLCRARFRRFDYVRHHPQEIEGLLHPFF
jgi:hypothetical protein